MFTLKCPSASLPYATRVGISTGSACRPEPQIWFGGQALRLGYRRLLHRLRLLKVYLRQLNGGIKVWIHRRRGSQHAEIETVRLADTI
jgi:hypothetical protein